MGIPKHLQTTLLKNYNDTNSAMNLLTKITKQTIKTYLKYGFVPLPRPKREFLIKTCISKIQRLQKSPIKFVVLYNTKKISFFTSNKDKVPLNSKRDVVYQVTSPGCNKSYIGKTFRCLDDRLLEHAKYHQTSTIAQHFLECENAQFMSNLNNLYDRLNNTHFHTNTMSCMKILINSNCKILYHNNSVKNNQLLLLEALHIKFLKPELNPGLKASKDLTLFC